MKVLVEGKLYDTNDTPVLIIVSDNEKSLIGNMTGEKGRFYSFPDTMTQEEMRERLWIDSFSEEQLAKD